MSTESQSNGPIKPVRSLTEVPVDEATYKADLEVTDRYQNFSMELLRVSLLGIGVFGFLLKEVILNDKDNYMHPFVSSRWWFVLGLLALAVSAAFALAHRYVSSDCIACQIRYLRQKHARDEALKHKAASEVARKLNDGMQEEKDDLKVQLKRGGLTLRISAIALGIGVALIAVGFINTIFTTKVTGNTPGSTNATLNAASPNQTR
jgi:hypothetical protein